VAWPPFFGGMAISTSPCHREPPALWGAWRSHANHPSLHCKELA